MAYVTNWQLIEPQIGQQRIYDASDSQQHPLGTIRRAKDTSSNDNGEGEFIYVRGLPEDSDEDIEVGDWVTYSEGDYSTQPASAGGQGQVGVMMSKLDSPKKYGWLQITGKAVANASEFPGGVQRAKALSEPGVAGPEMAEYDLNRPYLGSGG